MAQKRAQGEQDGSEIKSVELERLIALGLSLSERRNAFEYIRDAAAGVYRVQTGSIWRPRSGSQVNHRTMTAAMIDSRGFIAAQRRAESEILMPPGPRIAFTGGQDYQDYERIWNVLDWVKAMHAQLSPLGWDRINLTGDYVWSDRLNLGSDGLMPPLGEPNGASVSQ
ncbi:hypothetical protein ASF53_24485 [Methylobacterium sp. Leaf123]|nr:hypothetical protein ASF53_24485 [Methylobacterium sp. Leaf123]